jgi:hypothetical protein
MAKQVGKSKRVKEFDIANLTGGMDIATDPFFLYKDATCAQLIENMEFDSEGERLMSRRGLGSPIQTFDSNIRYIWYDYGMNDYLIFLENKNVYKYEYGGTPSLIGVINGDLTHNPQITRYTNANGTYLLIASGGTLQYYEYSGTSISTDLSYPLIDGIMERFTRMLVYESSTNNIKYSGVADPFNWTENSNDASAMKDLDVGDVSPVVGIYPLADVIIVFKENGRIYKIANEPEDWNVSLVGTDSDFVSRDSMTNFEEDVVFFSRQGLRSLATTETYGDFTTAEVGEKMNPEMKKDYSSSYMVKDQRTNQLFINPNRGKIVYVYHYRLKAFTKWTFPENVLTIAPAIDRTLVGIGKEVFNLDSKNNVDVVGGVSTKIHQKIVSAILSDLNIMTLYRSHLMITSDKVGTATLTVNDTTWKWPWTIDEQRQEFKTQIRKNQMLFTFETDDIITFHYWIAVIVQQYVAMTATQSSDSSPSWGSGKWGQGTFGGVTNGTGGSPYG